MFNVVQELTARIKQLPVNNRAQFLWTACALVMMVPQGSSGETAADARTGGKPGQLATPRSPFRHTRNSRPRAAGRPFPHRPQPLLL